MYPRIDSPCPLKSLQLPATGNFNCANCRREVHDLSALNELQRRTFLASCEGEVCVSYKLPKGLKKAALAGVFLVANGLALNVAAQSPAEQGSAANNSPTILEEDVFVAGGIENPRIRAFDKNSSHLEDQTSLQLIPTVEED